MLKRATIATSEGKLAPGRTKLYDVLAKHGYVLIILANCRCFQLKSNLFCCQRQGAKVKANQRVLLLGSGFVSAPLVDYLLREPNRSVTIGMVGILFYKYGKTRARF